MCDETAKCDAVFPLFSTFPRPLRIMPEFEQNGRFGFWPQTPSGIDAALPDINHLSPNPSSPRLTKAKILIIQV